MFPLKKIARKELKWDIFFDIEMGLLCSSVIWQDMYPVIVKIWGVMCKIAFL